jgi:Heterokaryon incompatibility protein (HET)
MAKPNLTHILAEDEIRVLEYDATQSGSSGLLACRKRIIKLADVNGETGPYAALSYVWGDPALTQPIICDGMTISITSNLRNALSTIWKAHPSTHLWADALSITQDNLMERNQQVSLMAGIFRSAHIVFVSLGPSLRGDNRFWVLLQSFVSTGSFGGQDFEDELDEFMERQPNKLAIGLYDLIQRPWFRRAWVSLQHKP